MIVKLNEFSIYSKIESIEVNQYAILCASFVEHKLLHYPCFHGGVKDRNKEHRKEWGFVGGGLGWGTSARGGAHNIAVPLNSPGELQIGAGVEVEVVQRALFSSGNFVRSTFVLAASKLNCSPASLLILHDRLIEEIEIIWLKKKSKKEIPFNQ